MGILGSALDKGSREGLSEQVAIERVKDEEDMPMIRPVGRTFQRSLRLQDRDVVCGWGVETQSE